jgi:hypothetical protein
MMKREGMKAEGDSPPRHQGTIGRSQPGEEADREETRSQIPDIREREGRPGEVRGQKVEVRSGGQGETREDGGRKAK